MKKQFFASITTACNLLLECMFLVAVQGRVFISVAQFLCKLEN